jgi:hypothetical protein
MPDILKAGAISVAMALGPASAIADDYCKVKLDYDILVNEYARSALGGTPENYLPADKLRAKSAAECAIDTATMSPEALSERTQQLQEAVHKNMDIAVF